MPNNISTNKSGFWARKNERNGPPFNSTKDTAANANPSMQDKDANWATNQPVMKATAHLAGMQKDGGVPDGKWAIQNKKSNN